MIESLVGIVLFTVLIEAVTEGVKSLREEGKLNTNVLTSLVLSLVGAVGFNIDLFAMVGFETGIPFLGAVLTGVIASRGTNVVHDLIEKLNAYKQ